MRAFIGICTAFLFLSLTGAAGQSRLSAQPATGQGATSGAAPRTVKELTGARDRWQHPEDVMNSLKISQGAVVADVGRGDGYFSFHLAQRTGPTGRVYAVDLEEQALTRLKSWASQFGITNIQTVQGKANDPMLPEGALDAVLVVNAYHEFKEHEAVLRAIYRGLKPGGLLGILEWHADLGQPRTYYEGRHELPGEILIQEAIQSGFRIHSFRQDFAKPPEDKKHYYFVIFRKPD